MPSFQVAHLREQGQNMLLFPLSSDFEHRTPSDRNDIVSELQARARSAGLAGTAAVFWQYGGQTRFIGPRQWQPFLKGLSMAAVQRNVNKTVSW